MNHLTYFAPKGVALTIHFPAYDGEYSSQHVDSPAGLDTQISVDNGAATAFVAAKLGY